MWTPVTRRQHSRSGLRYARDRTDDEWRILEPLLPGDPLTDLGVLQDKGAQLAVIIKDGAVVKDRRS